MTGQTHALPNSKRNRNNLVFHAERLEILEKICGEQQLLSTNKAADEALEKWLKMRNSFSQSSNKDGEGLQ